MENETDIIQYRLNKSYEAIEEALLLLNAKHYNSVASRLYYAAFYAVSALLFQDGFYSKTHSGLKSLFHEHLIKTGKVSNEHTKIYKDLFDNRQDADYGDFVTFTQEEVEPLIRRTQSLINEIKKSIK